MLFTICWWEDTFMQEGGGVIEMVMINKFIKISIKMHSHLLPS